MKKIFVAIIIFSIFVYAWSSITQTKRTNSVGHQGSVQTSNQKSYGQLPAQASQNNSNAKAKGQYYRMLAEQQYRKAKNEQSHVDFAKKNLDKNPSSTTAYGMYNSAVLLQQTYQNIGDKYIQMALQAEAGS